MDILFENHYERTPAVMKELYRMIYFKRPVNLVIYVVLGGIAVANIITAFFSREYSFTGCLVDEAWRQRRSIGTYTRQECNPLAMTILK